MMKNRKQYYCANMYLKNTKAALQTDWLCGQTYLLRSILELE